MMELVDMSNLGFDKYFIVVQVHLFVVFELRDRVDGNLSGS